MIRTQIQLPDRLYAQAKRIAREREFSLAEVLRRGVEYMVLAYPPLDQEAGQEWKLPPVLHLGMHEGTTLEDLRVFHRDAPGCGGHPATGVPTATIHGCGSAALCRRADW